MKFDNLIEEAFSAPPDVIVSNKFLEIYGEFIEVLGADKFIELSKRLGGKRIPRFEKLKSIIKEEVEKEYRKRNKSKKYIDAVLDGCDKQIFG
jgi:hypothetical protein